jgi:hypothetical protein
MPAVAYIYVLPAILMMKFPKFQVIILSILLIASCAQDDSRKPKVAETDSLVLKVYFNPAFEENSETTLWSYDSTQGIKILIKNNVRVDEKEDTFWFKSISLTKQQYLQLDSTLIKMCRRKTNPKTYTVFDGMGIETLLTNKADTNSIYFWSPSKKTDSIGYVFTKSLFKIIGNTFHDTLINEYFNDLEGYIEESKLLKAERIRKIDHLRIKKYNWTIRKTS